MAQAVTMQGSCQCGQVGYEVTGPPIASIVCHCRDCQKLSASAWSTTLVLEAGALALHGELARWDRVADSGTPIACYFCPRCGNRIYHDNPDDPRLRRLKAGTLDSDPIPAPQLHVWVSRKQPWVEIPEGVPAFEQNVQDLPGILARLEND